MKKKSKTIYEFVRSLNKRNYDLLMDYIKKYYISGVYTGKGKKKNFFMQYNSPEGIKIVQEILKFLRVKEKLEAKYKKRNNK